jgi:hypothetical protein
MLASRWRALGIAGRRRARGAAACRRCPPGNPIFGHESLPIFLRITAGAARRAILTDAQKGVESAIIDRVMTEESKPE